MDIGNRIVWKKDGMRKVETVTITGDDAGLEEGMLALQKGAVVTEVNLVYKENELEWRFNLKGESLGISSLRCPATGSIENDEDLEGAVLEKMYLYDKVVNLVENLYKQFVVIRVAPTWKSSVVPSMKKWIKE